jgi:hypothetical protein
MNVVEDFNKIQAELVAVSHILLMGGFPAFQMV